MPWEKYRQNMKGLEGGRDCFWVVLALVLDLGASVGFGGLALKGKDIVAEKWLFRGPSQPSMEYIWEI